MEKPNINRFKVQAWVTSGFRRITRKQNCPQAHGQPKLGLSRRRLQLKGGRRVTESIVIKKNRIVFDHQKGEIADTRKLIKVIYSLGKRRKLMGKLFKDYFNQIYFWYFLTNCNTIEIGKIEDIQEIKVGMQTANFIELKNMIEDGKVQPINDYGAH